jgi:hypothetical protein
MKIQTRSTLAKSLLLFASSSPSKLAVETAFRSVLKGKEGPYVQGFPLNGRSQILELNQIRNN